MKLVERKIWRRETRTVDWDFTGGEAGCLARGEARGKASECCPLLPANGKVN